MRVDWATHAASLHAVRAWHYSRSLPAGRLLRVGVWDDDGRFCGAIVFARGANQNMGKGEGFAATEVCELCRVALREHGSFTVTSAVSAAIKLLRSTSPGILAIYSYADPMQGHHGGIYQAGNWIYTGASAPGTEYFHDGEWKHSRAVYPPSFDAKSRASNRIDLSTLKSRRIPGKHRYVMPLRKSVRRRLLKLAKVPPSRYVAPAVALLEGSTSPVEIAFDSTQPLRDDQSTSAGRLSTSEGE